MTALRGALRLAALTLLVAYASAQPAMTEGLLKDREALLALKDSLTSYGQSKIASWRPTGNPCFPKRWAHIACSNSRVVEINLSNRQVVGVLPEKLRLAKDLITINFEGNKFTGNIPNSWAGKNAFTQLRTLNLANNELAGSLPTWNRLGAWRSLENIDLSNNKFVGGLPNNWLGKQKPLRNVRFMDLSNNQLGTSVAGVAAAVQADWCKPEGALTTGSGWCPAGTPIAGTAASMVSLDISNNGFKGVIPLQWPVIFTRLQYLSLQFNTLYAATADVPAGLPALWSAPGKRGFPALSMLTLYPGNDYLCAVPDLAGGFLDVNRDATYQIADSNDEVYTGDNPRVCPTPGITDDNPPTSVTFTDETAFDIAWAYSATSPIWGFKVTIYGQDTEGGEWTPIENWNARRLRIYTSGGDSFDAAAVAALGISGEATATTTVTFADITNTDYLTAPDLTAATTVISNWRVEVSIINLDGVESTAKTDDLVNA